MYSYFNIAQMVTIGSKLILIAYKENKQRDYVVLTRWKNT